jgi:hypothetical protein
MWISHVLDSSAGLSAGLWLQLMQDVASVAGSESLFSHFTFVRLGCSGEQMFYFPTESVCNVDQGLRKARLAEAVASEFHS